MTNYEGSRGSGKGEPVPDYRVYRMTAGDWIRCLLTYTLFDGMISLAVLPLLDCLCGGASGNLAVSEDVPEGENPPAGKKA